jgi:hypothetical protein
MLPLLISINVLALYKGKGRNVLWVARIDLSISNAQQNIPSFPKKRRIVCFLDFCFFLRQGLTM